MFDEGGVDERRNGVRGEREHGGRGNGEDVRRDPIKPEPPRSPTLRDGLLIFLSLNLSLWPLTGCCLSLNLNLCSLIGCRLVDDVCDDRLPTTTSASRGTTPPRRSRAVAEAASGGHVWAPRAELRRARRLQASPASALASPWARERVVTDSQWSECDWLD
jgi:hypothetical protein